MEKMNFTPDNALPGGAFENLALIQLDHPKKASEIVLRGRRQKITTIQNLCSAKARHTPATLGIDAQISVGFQTSLNSWAITRTLRHQAPQCTTMALHEALEAFEAETSLKAPVVHVAHIGKGVFRFSAAGVEKIAPDLWHMEEGQSYDSVMAFAGTQSYVPHRQHPDAEMVLTTCDRSGSARVITLDSLDVSRYMKLMHEGVPLAVANATRHNMTDLLNLFEIPKQAQRHLSASMPATTEPQGDAHMSWHSYMLAREGEPPRERHRGELVARF